MVDLTDGRVTKLPELVSIAYFNPGCGDGEQAVLSRPQGDGTQLLTVDTRQGKLVRRQTVPGQLTSAVPFGSGIAAAAGDSVVSVNGGGHVSTLAHTGGTPFRLVPDAHSGLAYQVPAAKKTVQVRRVTSGGSDRLLGSGALGSLAVRGNGGRVFVTGKDAQDDVRQSALPKSWRALQVPASAEVSTNGLLALTGVGNGTEVAGSGKPGATATADTAQPVGIDALLAGSGESLGFRVKPRAPARSQGDKQSPALSSGTAGTKANAEDGGLQTESIRTESLDGSGLEAAQSAQSTSAATTTDDDPAHTTTDPDRACAVTRNDPGLQALQPSTTMIEWAADLAVQGKLDVRRHKGWNGTDLASYTPQSLFPSVPLKGGGRVPAQIMLGVLAQESNLVQANSRASAGESGNFVQGGYYGNAGSVHTVNWAAADCGYGVAQVTSGMARTDTTTYTAEQQKAITVDYAANIAAGLQILQDKWNQLYDKGMLVNGGDPQYLENWWFALWAYNSGFNAPSASDTAAPWGLGWFNNPANGLYPADRKMFLSSGYEDARTPNLWTYPERVLGWAAYSCRRRTRRPARPARPSPSAPGRPATRRMPSPRTTPSASPPPTSATPPSPVRSRGPASPKDRASATTSSAGGTSRRRGRTARPPAAPRC